MRAERFPTENPERDDAKNDRAATPTQPSPNVSLRDGSGGNEPAPRPEEPQRHTLFREGERLHGYGRSSGSGPSGIRLPTQPHCRASSGVLRMPCRVDPATRRPVTAARPRRIFTAFPFQSAEVCVHLGLTDTVTNVAVYTEPTAPQLRIHCRRPYRRHGAARPGHRGARPRERFVDTVMALIYLQGFVRVSGRTGHCVNPGQATLPRRRVVDQTPLFVLDCIDFDGMLPMRRVGTGSGTVR